MSCVGYFKQRRSSSSSIESATSITTSDSTVPSTAPSTPAKSNASVITKVEPAQVYEDPFATMNIMLIVYEFEGDNYQAIVKSQANRKEMKINCHLGSGLDDIARTVYGQFYDYYDLILQ